MAVTINPDTVRAVDLSGPWGRPATLGLHDPTQSPGDHLGRPDPRFVPMQQEPLPRDLGDRIGRPGDIVRVPPGESFHDYGMRVLGSPLSRPPSDPSGGAGNIQSQRHAEVLRVLVDLGGAILRDMSRLEDSLKRRLEDVDAVLDKLRDPTSKMPLRDPEAGMVNRVFPGRPR